MRVEWRFAHFVRISRGEMYLGISENRIPAALLKRKMRYISPGNVSERHFLIHFAEKCIGKCMADTFRSLPSHRRTHVHVSRAAAMAVDSDAALFHKFVNQAIDLLAVETSHPPHDGVGQRLLPSHRAGPHLP